MDSLLWIKALKRLATRWPRRLDRLQPAASQRATKEMTEHACRQHMLSPIPNIRTCFILGWHKFCLLSWPWKHTNTCRLMKLRSYERFFLLSGKRGSSLPSLCVQRFVLLLCQASGLPYWSAALRPFRTISPMSRRAMCVRGSCFLWLPRTVSLIDLRMVWAWRP